MNLKKKQMNGYQDVGCAEEIIKNKRCGARAIQGGETETIRAIYDYLLNLSGFCKFNRLSKNKLSIKNNNIDFYCVFFSRHKKIEAAIIVVSNEREKIIFEKERILRASIEYENVIKAKSIRDVEYFLEKNGVLDEIESKKIKRKM